MSQAREYPGPWSVNADPTDREAFRAALEERNRKISDWNRQEAERLAAEEAAYMASLPMNIETSVWKADPNATPPPPPKEPLIPVTLIATEVQQLTLTTVIEGLEKMSPAITNTNWCYCSAGAMMVIEDLLSRLKTARDDGMTIGKGMAHGGKR